MIKRTKTRQTWVNACVCVAPKLYECARRRARSSGANFSQYIRILIENDIARYLKGKTK